YIGYKYRFDLLYHINVLARYTLYPSKTVMEMAKQLIQYLWCTRNKMLRWFKEDKHGKNHLKVIADAAFASQDDYKSQYGNYYYLNNNVIGGKSSKSTLTCTSSTEAEIYAISESIPRIEIFELLIEEINKTPIEKEIITDSKPSISSFTAIDESRMKAKFFTTRLLRAKEEIKRQNIKMSYVETKNNTADILTKPVQVKDFIHLTENWIL
ncbi:Putative Ty retrotransposon (partial), partial [Maudiozyma saulgeensis]